MRRVAGIPILVAFALALAITSLLLLPGGKSADAVPWSTSYSATLASSGAGDNATTVTVTTIPSPSYFFDTLITLTPNGFDSADDADIPDGAVVGDFATIVSLGIANGPCTTVFPVNATLLDATTDTGGGFVPLSLVAGGDSDDTNTLVAFTSTESHTDGNLSGTFDPGEKVYDDIGSGNVGSVGTGDFRFNSAGLSAPGSTVGVPDLATFIFLFGPGLGPIIFGASNPDLGLTIVPFNEAAHADGHTHVDELHDESTTVNGSFDLLEEMYVDDDASSAVSDGDIRLTPIGGLVTFDEGFADGAPAGPGPADGIPDGATSYPVAVESRLPQSSLGVPTSRIYAQTTVLGTRIEVHTVFYSPGSLGLPASLGSPSLTFFVTGDPGVPQPGNVSDQCSFFTSTYTTLGVSVDNANSAADEGGFVVNTNPTVQGLYLFASLAIAQRDFDNDSFENQQDACQLAPNLEDLRVGGLPGDPDGDGIDSICDPFPGSPDGPDIDGDGFLNRLDNCVLVFNPSQLESEDLNPGAFGFDGGPKADEIGDACDPAPTVPLGHYHTSSPTGTSGPLCVVSANCGGPTVEAALGCTGTPGTLCTPLPVPGPFFFSPVVIGPPHDVAIADHGVKGKKKVRGASTQTYRVDVLNRGEVTEDIQVQLRVDALTADCTVNGGDVSQTQTDVASSVAPNQTDRVTFSVTFDGCASATGADTTSVDYLVTADVCHQGDLAPGGFAVGVDCPGTNDGETDGDAFNDSPKTKSVNDKLR